MLGQVYLCLLVVRTDTSTLFPVRTDRIIVPDFRSENGIFATSGKHLFDASVYQTDESTSEFHDMVRDMSEKSVAAEATEFHHLIASLASEGRLMRLYTQNVDGLDTSLPPLATTIPLGNKGPWPPTIQLHGGLQKMVCTKCNNISDFESALFRGPIPPPCPVCIEADKVRTDHAGKRSHGVGKLRPKMLLYNEFNPDEEAIGAATEADLRARPDAVIVVGTKMKVPGLRRTVREMCGVVRGRKDGEAIWISREPPPPGREFENCWDLIVRGDSDTVAAHARMRRWDDDSVDYKECSESDSERAKANDANVKVVIEADIGVAKAASPEVKVIVETPARKAVASALLTPAPSPRSKSVDPTAQLKIFPNLKAFGKNEHKVSNKSAKPKQPLGATNKPSANKKKTLKSANKNNLKSGKSSAMAKPSNMSINTAFKVSKPQPQSKLSKVAPQVRKPKAVIIRKDVASEAPGPMAPISPSAARNNGPLLPQPARTPLKPQFPNLTRQKSSPIQASTENIDDLKESKPRAAIKAPEVAPRSPTTLSETHDVTTRHKSPEVATRSPTIWSEQHEVTTRNSPSRPFYDKDVSVTFFLHNSPSKPPFEKFILPGDPGYPNRPTDEYTFSSGNANDHAADATARQLFPSTKTRLENTTQKPEGGGRLKRMSEEIVRSPTVPGGMGSLLN